MAKKSKKEFKQYTINNVQDACSVLGGLIARLIVQLEKYKEYAAEAEELLNNTAVEYVAEKEYCDINDKLLYRQHEMLKLVADHQNSSFSYIDLRKMFEKKGYLNTSLSEDMEKTLKELLDVRNWTFHNPQSLMVASKEVAEKNIPDELKGLVTITPQLNPIVVSRVEKYEVVMLASLVLHIQRRIEQFDAVLAKMKSDYQEMYNTILEKKIIITPYGALSEVQYYDEYIIARLESMSNDIAQLSMGIQKSQYDGTDEQYNKWTLHLSDTVEESE